MHRLIRAKPKPLIATNSYRRLKLSIFNCIFLPISASFDRKSHIFRAFLADTGKKYHLYLRPSAWEAKAPASRLLPSLLFLLLPSHLREFLAIGFVHHPVAKEHFIYNSQEQLLNQRNQSLDNSFSYPYSLHEAQTYVYIYLHQKYF